MGPRKSRRQGFIRFPQAKKIFDVDCFLEDRQSQERSPKVSMASTGQRWNDPGGCFSRLEVHLWSDFESRKPHRTEVIHLPIWWTGRMYLAALLMPYNQHECICIRTQHEQCGLVDPPFRSFFLISCLFESTEKEIQEWLQSVIHEVEGGLLI